VAPTNIMRAASDRSRKAAKGRSRRKSAPREIVIHAGIVVVRARLAATPTADRLWAALPLYSTVERWGQGAIHCAVPVETGLEPRARDVVKAGDIAFWIEEGRVLIGFGPTPLSRGGEIRLPSPANIWATALDDVTALAAIGGGEQIAILEADS
jgi:hypothetical protein